MPSGSASFSLTPGMDKFMGNWDGIKRLSSILEDNDARVEKVAVKTNLNSHHLKVPRRLRDVLFAPNNQPFD